MATSSILFGAAPQPDKDTSLYARLGGADAFEQLVERFYNGVARDAVLRPLYPDDLAESKRTLALFLIQFFGGPTDYSNERGHPRLRMRHLPFAIGQAERDAWVQNMKNAVESGGFSPEIEATLLEYFERVATFMMNQ